MLKLTAASADSMREGGIPMPAELYENRTKNDLDRALRQLLEDRPLDQIRVRELTALCGIRRQSFYYHFPDVYALFDWSLRQEAAGLAARQERCLTWRQAVTDLLGHIGRHRRYYQALLKSRGRPGLRTLLQDAYGGLVPRALEYYRRRGGGDPDPERDQTDSLCWETLLLSLAEAWAWEEAAQPPEKLLLPLETLLRQGSLGEAWQNLGNAE